jgi:hypothetical protein
LRRRGWNDYTIIQRKTNVIAQLGRLAEGMQMGR